MKILFSLICLLSGTVFGADNNNEHKPQKPCENCLKQMNEREAEFMQKQNMKDLEKTFNENFEKEVRLPRREDNREQKTSDLESPEKPKKDHTSLSNADRQELEENNHSQSQKPQPPEDRELMKQQIELRFKALEKANKEKQTAANNQQNDDYGQQFSESPNLTKKTSTTTNPILIEENYLPPKRREENSKRPAKEEPENPPREIPETLGAINRELDAIKAEKRHSDSSSVVDEEERELPVKSEFIPIPEETSSSS